MVSDVNEILSACHRSDYSLPGRGFLIDPRRGRTATPFACVLPPEI